jgi:hypothetical protein
MGFKWRIATVFLLGVLTIHGAPAPAELKDLDAGVFAAFAEKASETVELTLDEKMLKMGAGFFSSADQDSAKIKKLIAGLKSVTVRSFEFKTKGKYTKADVDAIRRQLKTPEWSSVVNARDKETGETTEVYALADKPGGLLIIAADPTQLTFVQILGAVDISDLSAFDFGLPDMGLTHKGKKDNK